jgi:DivIVA domain-containing protein
MWLAGGLAVVAAGIVVVALAFLEGGPRVLPPVRHGTVTIDELRHPDLPSTWRGYDRGHVDALLARAARTLEDVHRYGPEVQDEETGPVTREGVARSPGPPAEPPSFLREELQDRGGDDAGGLDG